MSALVLLVVQFVAVLVVTLNYRYCAKGKIAATVITDVMIFSLQFFVLKRVVEASSFAEALGYVLGSSLGSIAGMLYTKGLKEHEG